MLLDGTLIPTSGGRRTEQCTNPAADRCTCCSASGRGGSDTGTERPTDDPIDHLVVMRALDMTLHLVGGVLHAGILIGREGCC